MDSEFQPFALGTISDKGKFIPDSQEVYELLFKQFPANSKVTVTVKQHKNTRSLKQNAYYFGVVVPAFFKWLIDNGHDDILCLDDVHELLLYKLNPSQIIDLGDGEIIRITKRSKKLSTTDFNLFFQRAIQYIAEITKYELNILYPNETKL